MSAPPDAPQRASLRERALRLLARREYSRAELRCRLSAPARKKSPRHGHEGGEQTLNDPNQWSPDDLTANVESILDALAESGLLSDARYATQRADGRGKRLGNARLAHELRTKGVDAAIIGEALTALGDETERARSVWQRKFGTRPGSREEWGRQARFLQYRGFSSATIRALLRDPEQEISDEPTE